MSYLERLQNFFWETILTHLPLLKLPSCLSRTIATDSFLTGLFGNNYFSLQVYLINCWQNMLCDGKSPTPAPVLMVHQDSQAAVYISTQWLWLCQKDAKQNPWGEKLHEAEPWGNQAQASRVLSQWRHTEHMQFFQKGVVTPCVKCCQPRKHIRDSVRRVFIEGWSHRHPLPLAHIQIPDSQKGSMFLFFYF